MKSDTNIVASVADCLSEGKESEKDAEATGIGITASSSNDTNERNVESVTNKVAKLSIENGTWNCSYSLCIANDDNDMIIMLEMQKKTSLRLYKFTRLSVITIFIKDLKEKILMRILRRNY